MVVARAGKAHRVSDRVVAVTARVVAPTATSSHRVHHVVSAPAATVAAKSAAVAASSRVITAVPGRGRLHFALLDARETYDYIAVLLAAAVPQKRQQADADRRPERSDKDYLKFLKPKLYAQIDAKSASASIKVEEYWIEISIDIIGHWYPPPGVLGPPRPLLPYALPLGP